MKSLSDFYQATDVVVTVSIPGLAETDVCYLIVKKDKDSSVILSKEGVNGVDETVFTLSQIETNQEPGHYLYQIIKVTQAGSISVIEPTTREYQRVRCFYRLNSVALPSPPAATSRYGPTANRPLLTAEDIGYVYFDTDIGSPVWFSGTEWV